MQSTSRTGEVEGTNELKSCVLREVFTFWDNSCKKNAASSETRAALASFLAFYMNLMFDNVRLLTTNSSSELFEQMVRINCDDVIIGISFPRYSMRTLKALEFANNRSAKVITITDSVHSPMNLYSSCNLIADSDMASIVDSLVAPLSVINALIVALCMRRHQEVGKILTELEDIWDEYQVYENDEIDVIDDSIKAHYAKLGDVDNE